MTTRAAIPHIPTNLPLEERAVAIEAAGFPLSAIGLARAEDGSLVAVEPEAETAPVLVDEPGEPKPFDTAAAQLEQSAFFEAHATDLAGASDAELRAFAEATHGDTKQAELDAVRAAHEAEIANASAVLVAPDGSPIANAPDRLRCSAFDLVNVASRLLAAQVSASYGERSDPTSVQITGGLLAADANSVDLALDAAAALFRGAQKRIG